VLRPGADGYRLTRRAGALAGCWRSCAWRSPHARHAPERITDLPGTTHLNGSAALLAACDQFLAVHIRQRLKV
jgi:hypothetical protein